MTPPGRSSPFLASRAAGARPDRTWRALAALAVLVGGAVAYWGSLSGPFVFDDAISIADNATIRHLWPVWDVLATPRANVTTQGRPVLNLSFAVNYALSGTAVWSYHLVNVAIHLLGGLTLFGIVRRTMLRSTARGPVAGATLRPEQVRLGAGTQAALCAGAVALLWTVHPLQTEAVTYIVQRAESLMGLFYLLTLYGFIRLVETESARSRLLWGLASAIACSLGAATKEVMVSAPIIVLAYDRTFVAGTFVRAWRSRWRYFLLLAGSWLVLGASLARGGGTRGGAIGFGVAGAWWSYAATQFEAIGRYLVLSLWPHPLVFEYGAFEVTDLMSVLPWAALVIPAIAATIWAFWRRPALGFLGVWFFAMLAPTSLVPGTSQMIVEHRMYLSLAAVLTLAVYAVHVVALTLTPAVRDAFGARGASASPGAPRPTRGSSPAPLAAGALLTLMAAGPLVLLTQARNTVYRDPLVLWTDTIVKRPANPLAPYMRGEVFVAKQQWSDAQREFEKAIALHPRFVIARERLGEVLVRLGKPAEAARQFETVLQEKPDLPDAHDNLGSILVQQGRYDEALVHLRRAVTLDPAYADAHDNLGVVCASAGRPAEAAGHFRAALRLAPDRASTHYHLANTLVELGRATEAIAEYGEALRLQPDLPAAEFNLANTFAAQQRHAEALAHYRAALRLSPGYAAAEFNLANSLAALGRFSDAAGHYAHVLQRQPDNAAAEENLGSALLEMGRLDDAEAHYRRALQLEPDSRDVRANLARVRAMRGR